MNGNGLDIKQDLLLDEEITLPILLLSVFFAIIKRPWIIMLSVLIVMIPVTYVLFSKVPIYTASSKVMVSVEGLSAAPEFSVGTPVPYYSRGKTQAYYTNLLHSREYRKRVRERLLEKFPELPADTLITTVRDIRHSINPREEEFITIIASSPSPKLAYAGAEVALEEFRNRCILLERQDSEQVSDFIDDQINLTSVKMETAEGDLQQFLADKNIVTADAEGGVGQELLELERGRSEAKANLEMVRINIDSYNNQISSLLNKLSVAPAGIPHSKDVSVLRLQLNDIKEQLSILSLTSGNEAQIRELQKERKQILNELVQLSIGAKNGEEEDQSQSILSLHELQRQLDAALMEEVKYKNESDFYSIKIKRFKTEHPNLPKDILEYARLVRAKDVLERTLYILLDKREEARIKVAAEQGGVKIIDEPVYPTQPISERKISKTVLAFFLSVILGIVLCTAVDFFDSTIKDENDIRKLGVSPLGAIPVFAPKIAPNTLGRKNNPRRTNTVRGRQMLIFESQKSYVAEAYRSLKISLQFAATDKGKNVFVVSSPGVGEGKSLTTANLAVAFAQGGKKTLIVDLDLRRSTQNRFFDVPRKPGITEYLLEGVELDNIIKSSGVPNLHIITGGSSPPNPAELVSSRAMGDFITRMRSEYDIVLIDTPPILVCTDPMSVAEYTDGMIIMVKMEHTNAKTLEYAINTVKKINIEIMGVILNHTSYRYGTAYYYFYRYYRPYTYYSTYRYYSYYYGDYGDKNGVSEQGKRRKRRRKSTDTTSYKQRSTNGEV